MSGFRATRLPNEQRAVDTGIGLLRAAGFPPRDAVRHYHVFVDTVLGHAALDAAVQGLRPEQREADEGAWAAVCAGVSPDTHPHLHEAREHLPLMRHSAFERALDLLLGAIDSAPR
ncbi:TetR/AcrR family transcriptional regulator C-terminal domain-containing protein [Streptomyces sp. NPDC088745]|uniref:TetR/AcrR family transcriptional regulator C-terminal domain-containing protein n=1 Tax=Streptomyces sp. NPDC088745 TaxID=3365884 RepID=UPI003819EAFE